MTLTYSHIIFATIPVALIFSANMATKICGCASSILVLVYRLGEIINGANTCD
jgi:hypothetical protein